MIPRRPYLRFLAGFPALVLAAAPLVAQVPKADTADAVHLLRRATFGVRPADVAAVLRLGEEAWLDRQLHPDRIPDGDLAARLEPYAWLDLPMASLPDRFPPVDRLRDEIAQRHDIDPADLTDPERVRDLPREAIREFRERSPRRLYDDLATAKLVRAVHTERQLAEVMADFWFNHFNVWAGKQLTRYMVADYERTAIRPNVFGRFEDMLLATARHPAMLFYLDNWTSVAPDSMRASPTADQGRQLRRLASLSDEQKQRLVRNGRITREQLERLEEAGPMLEQTVRRMRDRGLNENYARELLELHTLGVDGGYTQTDVVNVARTLTGWTFVPFAAGARGPAVRSERAGAFIFNGPGHDAGAKTVLDVVFDEGGEAEGTALLRMLARRPETARFLSTKLIERFVTDAPDPAFVDELTAVWLRTDGDLREVTRALFSSRHFRDPAVHGAKVKTPFELVASTLRVSGGETRTSRRTLQTLRNMGNLPYDASAPTGYPAASEDWVNSGAMLARMNFALAFAGGRLDAVRPDGRLLIGAGGDPLDAILASVLPGRDVVELKVAIVADLEANAADASQRARLGRALGLALGSPEFQAR